MSLKYKYEDCCLALRWKKANPLCIEKIQECVKQNDILKLSFIGHHSCSIDIVKEDDYVLNELRKIQIIANEYGFVMIGSVKAIDRQDGWMFLYFPYGHGLVSDGSNGEDKTSKRMIQEQQMWHDPKK